MYGTFESKFKSKYEIVIDPKIKIINFKQLTIRSKEKKLYKYFKFVFIIRK